MRVLTILVLHGVETYSGTARCIHRLFERQLSSVRRDVIVVDNALTLCILNEQMLGVRLRALGCTLLDVTWFATQLGEPGVGSGSRSNDVFSTHWTRQLADRDRDRVSVQGVQ